MATKSREEENKRKAAERRARIAEGFCGNSRSHGPPVQMQRCSRCYEQYIAGRKLRLAARRAEGVCIYGRTHGPVIRAGKCARCVEQAIRSNAVYHARQKLEILRFQATVRMQVAMRSAARAAAARIAQRRIAQQAAAECAASRVKPPSRRPSVADHMYRSVTDTAGLLERFIPPPPPPR